ncbi:MAG: hypothetical protein K9N23_01490 [Akkermansiaceae bacterium]|nr:hypothetical protein [Akkermansiaceae bacterium]MCF7730324.1 hypothetical protein [Akkermansiaceae bacterium]
MVVAGLLLGGSRRGVVAAKSEHLGNVEPQPCFGGREEFQKRLKTQGCHIRNRAPRYIRNPVASQSFSAAYDSKYATGRNARRHPQSLAATNDS